MSTRKRVAVMISGRGSNLAALMEAASDPAYPAEIVGVVSDNPEAPGLTFAAGRGQPVAVANRRDHPSSDAHDATIDAALRDLAPDFVALAGYMRVLTAGFVAAWQGKLINIHPSLLPAFRGLDSHRQAIEAGVRVHGCSVHFVSPEVDAGPLIAQAAVPVLTGDTEEALAARVLKAEHKLYPIALAMVAEGRARLDGNRVVFDTSGASEKNGGQSVFSPDLTTDMRSIEDLARFTP
ncbi:MAG: phosphoribosylglycinamide formyltransferase [Rhizobiaceae bacterium]|nr:phosphoribosylglycinamide formyltransferase [Rhizobiaceae bacterium]